MFAWLRFLVGVIALVGCTSPALSDKRVALVIGNGAYVQVPSLPNPPNDAKAVAELLTSAGFDVVTSKINLSASAMRAALNDFADTMRDADLAVVFYAGHGIEVNGSNFLVPVDAKLARDVDVQDEAIPLERIMRTIEPARRLQLVILDACRDNPFVRSMKRTVTSRSVRSALAEIDERALPPNTLIGYAQKAGGTAEDGSGGNSPYTTALLKHLATPGLDVELALRRVRDDVLKATNNRQEPFRYGSLGGAELPLVAALNRVPAPPSAVESPPMKAPEDLAVDRPIKRTGTAGGKGGDPFDEKYINPEGAPLSGITVMVAHSIADQRQKLIASVQAHWPQSSGPVHGAAPGAALIGPDTRRITFDNDETVRAITIFHRRFSWPDPANAPVWISGIRIRTSKRTHTIGDLDGAAVECNPGKGGQVIGFFGRSGAYLDALGCLIR